MTPQKPKLIQLPLAGKIFLCVLAVVYVVYLAALGGYLTSGSNTSSVSHSSKMKHHSISIATHDVTTSPDSAIKHWTTANMRNAKNADPQVGNLTQVDTTASTASTHKPVREPGQPPQNEDSSYPLSTVGKVFFSNASGQDMVCSGTAVESLNNSVVDTAGHCLYWNGEWTQNVLFCPLYDNGETPYGCWAARDLVVPADWINARPNDLHHDFGMAIVTPNSKGNLTDVVGGAGWAYNEPTNLTFSAYGYPAAYPFDGQTRQSCEGEQGKSWKHGGGTVVSIPCNMTGGSSGGPWFIKIDGKWYLNGHNDFTSSMQPGHMFSPYYDSTWYALYDKARHA